MVSEAIFVRFSYLILKDHSQPHKNVQPAPHAKTRPSAFLLLGLLSFSSRTAPTCAPHIFKRRAPPTASTPFPLLNTRRVLTAIVSCSSALRTRHIPPPCANHVRHSGGSHPTVQGTGGLGGWCGVHPPHWAAPASDPSVCARTCVLPRSSSMSWIPTPTSPASSAAPRHVSAVPYL